MSEEIIIGKMGWGPEQQTLQEKLDTEKALFDKLAEDMPVRFSARSPMTINQEILNSYIDFCETQGYDKRSRTVVCMEQFVFKLPKKMNFVIQNIGSCVASNMFRAWMRRYLFEIALKGDLNNFIGRAEFGPASCAPFAAFNYGDSRKRGNMRGGDGSYCSVMGESLVKSGVILCDTPRLIEILKAEGVDPNKELPEISNEHLYRKFGDWAYIDELRKLATCTLLECADVKTIDDIESNLDQFKPMFQCSNIAIKSAGKDKDGFTIYTENKSDSWGHNMGIHGKRFSSSGQVYVEISNESWPGAPVYPVRIEEVKGWYDRGRCSTKSIGEIDGKYSIPGV